ncbi:hypothetical protein [Actinoallomurus vinaceus]
MGADQPWIHLKERAVKAMLAPLGVALRQADPGLIAAMRSAGCGSSSG